MQTFLPFENFNESAHCLDNKRLNKQIIEAYQILTDKVHNKNHPAVLMWADYKGFLYEYIIECCTEYKIRFDKTHSVFNSINYCSNFYTSLNNNRPFWFGDTLFHLAHKVNLLRKDYDFYKDKISCYYDLSEYPTGYYWPITVGAKSKSDTLNWVNWSKYHNEA